MDKLHLFIIAAFSIQSVAPLPQDYSLFDSSDQLASDPGSFNIASASPNEDLFSSFGSDTALGTQTTDWDPYDSGSNLDPLTLGDEIQWDLPSPEIAGSGCSGTLGKREGGTSCAATNQDQEEDPCDPDKEPMCCNPTQMFRSRWQGGGFNMDGCSQLLLSSACLASGGSVQCCIKQVTLLNSWRHGCTTSTRVKGNPNPNAPPPPPHQELPLPPQPKPVPEPIPELLPELAPDFNVPFTGF